MGAGAGSLRHATFSKEDMLRLQKRFQVFSRGLPQASFDSLLHCVELSANPFARKILALVDSDLDGKLSFDEYVKALEMVTTVRDQAGYCRLLFNIFDEDGDGHVVASDLYFMLKDLLGSHMSDAQVEAVVVLTLQQYGSDGSLTFDQFAAIVSAKDMENKLSISI